MVDSLLEGKSAHGLRRRTTQLFSKDHYPCRVIPLICIDVDGTLVSSSGKVSAPVWDAVDRALARGQHLALSTARGAFASSWDMAQRLDPAGWHVFHAGGATVNTGTGEARGHSLTPEQVAQCRTLATENDWDLELYAPDSYAVEDDSPTAVDHAGLMGVPFQVTAFDDYVAAQESIVRTQFVVPETAIDAVMAAAEPIGLSMTSATSPIMPGTAFVSATKPGITKATGITSICNELGLTIDQVMMIGDGLNDLPAIEAVGYPVAMGNAAPEVKALARHHVAHVDDDGVAEALDLSAKLEL